MYNYARTPAQIAWDYNRGKPTAYWKFDEGEGLTAVDASGNGLTGTLMNMDQALAWVSGKQNRALNFDGVDEYVNAGNATSLNIIGEITISAWIKPNVVNIAEQGIVNKSHTNSPRPYSLRLQNNRLRYEYYDGAQYRTYYSNFVITANEWQHISVVFIPASSIITFYRNGIAIGSSVTTGMPQGNSLNLSIGWDPGWTYFNGSIDDVRMYNYARTPEQVKQDHTGGAARFGPNEGIP